MEKKWYVVHVLSGHEKKVKTYLENEIKNAGMEDHISQILVPSEEIVEMKEGKKKVKTKVFFPGYMLIELVKERDVLAFIRNIPGITNFVGKPSDPQPLRDVEVERIIGRVEASKERKTMTVPYKMGDPIKVVDGPFTDFSGFVEEVNYEKNKLKVMVSIFGRSTPVELDFLQVEMEK